MKAKKILFSLLLGSFLPLLFIGVMMNTKTFAQKLDEQPFFVNEPWKGDFNGMAERRYIRALVVYSKSFYFLDKAQQKGISYDGLKQFEKFINKKLNNKKIKVNIIFIPVSRDRLLPGLVEGLGDIAVANLTITPERLKQVDFSDPALSGVKELVVSGPTSQKIASLDDLSGKEIHVRKSSSYYESLQKLNDRFQTEGKNSVKIVAANENLEDEDLLEMLNAGLIPLVVVDSHKAEFWVQIFDKITVHEDIAVSSEGDIGWAFRKNSPEFKAVVNEFVKQHKAGTTFGNILLKRYLKDIDRIKDSASEKELEKFRQTIDLFKKYAGQYQFDYLMVAAQAYQESRLDHSKVSPAGAVGVMQLLPSTAADKNIDIPDIHELENNIHAGTKYLRFITDRYFSDDNIDPENKLLLSFAAYNAGPAKIAKIRDDAKANGLDPNQWFRNVELSAAKHIGQETVHYVSNIYKYWITYSMIVKRGEVLEKTKSE
jgi:membrane-bound lytic murein transglycosylase MltF